MLNFLNSLLNSNAVSSESVVILYTVIGVVVVIVFAQFTIKLFTGKF